MIAIQGALRESGGAPLVCWILRRGHPWRHVRYDYGEPEDGKLSRFYTLRFGNEQFEQHAGSCNLVL